MNTIPHPNAPSIPESGVWDDVAGVVSALGSTLDPRELVTSIQELLSTRIGCTVEVFVFDREERLLRDLQTGWSCELHNGLAATLQLNSGPVRVEENWDAAPSHAGGHALGLRDKDNLVGVAFIDGAELEPDCSLPAIAALCGAEIVRCMSLADLAGVSGACEHSRNLQQEILDHISHEFNTPLMILRSSADFAREASEDERELFFDMHGQALDRLEQLVSGLIEVGHASVRGEREAMGTEDIVSALVLPLFVDAEWSDEVPELWHRSTPRQVEAEVDALGLAIDHLVRNARLHAASLGGKVAVAVYPSQLGGAPRRLDHALAALAGTGEQLPPTVEEPDALCVEVIDSGPGIPSDELMMIFEPFTQARNSPLRGVSGAGMGLATASQLLDTVGGRLDLESVEGAGSLFRVMLPAH
jgi:signal transduction histidine kinase